MDNKEHALDFVAWLVQELYVKNSTKLFYFY